MQRVSAYGKTEPRERPLHWPEVFPWLQGLPLTMADPDGDLDAWQRPIAPPGTSDRNARVDLLAQMVGTHLAKWSLAELFPAVSDSDIRSSLAVVATSGPDSGLASYAEGALPDINILTVSKICDGEIASVDAVVRWLISRQLSISTPTKQEAEQKATAPDLLASEASSVVEQESGDQLGNAVALTNGERDLISDLRLIANFRRSTGDTADRLFTTAGDLPLPRSVSQAIRRVRTMRTSSIGELAEHVDAASILNTLIGEHAEYALVALRQRLFADDPATFEAIAIKFSVTRERIRQVAGAARARLESSVENHPTLSTLNDGIVAAIGDLLPAHALLGIYPALGAEVVAVGQPVWRVLDRLDDSYEIADGWCAAPSVESAKRALTSKISDLANPHGVVSLEVLSAELPPYFGSPTNRSDLENWCKYCGWELQGEYLVVGARSLPDRAAATLAIVGKPLSSGEIHHKLGASRSIQSLKNALGSDQRFMRVDRDEWALVEWDLEEYTSIRGLIQTQVERGSGTVPLVELVESICRKYSVKETSVTAYAAAPPFETVAGLVRFETASRVPSRRPADTKRLYRDENAWLYRIEVTEDHMRGSGSPAPAAIVTALAIKNGGSRHFSSDSGSLSVRWTGLAPSFGSIRQRLIERRFRLHDSIFIVLYDSGAFDLRAVPALTGRSDIDIAALTGVQMLGGFDDFLALCGRALGVADASSLNDLLRQCATRGESDVQELVEQYIAELREASERSDELSVPGTSSKAGESRASPPPTLGVAEPEGVKDSDLDDLVSLQRDFRAAQFAGQYALAEQIQSEFGPRLRLYMRTRGLDVEAVLGILESAAELDAAGGVESDPDLNR